MTADTRLSLWRRLKANRNVRFLGGSVGVEMRILGATLLIVGFGLCFAIDDWEFIGLVPMAVGLTLLTIGEKKASTLALAQAALLAQMEKKTICLPQKQSSAADNELSAEVLQLLERLNRSSKLR